jgi:hypothetical protein
VCINSCICCPKCGSSSGLPCGRFYGHHMDCGCWCNCTSFYLQGHCPNTCFGHCVPVTTARRETPRETVLPATSSAPPMVTARPVTTTTTTPPTATQRNVPPHPANAPVAQQIENMTGE